MAGAPGKNGGVGGAYEFEGDTTQPNFGDLLLNISNPDAQAGSRFGAAVAGIGDNIIVAESQRNRLQVYNGAVWQALSGGAGGSAAGPNTAIQYNLSGAFAGDNNLTWDSSNQLLNINAKTTGVAGLNVAQGFVQSDQGFFSNYTSGATINVPRGGITALSLHAMNYAEVGSHSGTPPLSAGDTFSAGALYYDTSAGGLQIYNGTSWGAVGGGGTGTPGGGPGAVQFNNGSGGLGGVPGFQWDTTNQRIVVVGSGAQAAAIASR